MFAFFTNCTIQKRTVNKGYFVQWYSVKKSKTSLSSLCLSKIKEDNISDDLFLDSNIRDSSNGYKKSEMNSKTELLGSVNIEVTKNKILPNHYKKMQLQYTLNKNKIEPSKEKKLYKLEKIYFNKAKGKKALMYFGFLVGTLILTMISFWYALIYQGNKPDLLDGWLLLSFFFILMILVPLFALLSLLYLISAFIKPKEKTKS